MAYCLMQNEVLHKRFTNGVFIYGNNQGITPQISQLVSKLKYKNNKLYIEGD